MKRVIFDCDNTMGLPFKEVDDGLALLYLLGRLDIDLIAVTTTFGNGSAEQAFRQTQKLLAQAGRPDIPVFKGADQRHAPPTEAARFLAETTAAQPGEISLLATGPLGNLRGAAELDSHFYGNLQQIACMGGYLAPLRIGWRNVSELNLSADPEASYVVLNAPCPVTLMNAQICLQAAFTWRDLSRLHFWNKKTRRVVRNWLLVHGIFCGSPQFYLWDLLPAVYLSNPELFDSKWVEIISTIQDLEGGSLVFARESVNSQVNMPLAIKNPVQFKKVIFEAWEFSQVNTNSSARGYEL